MKKEMNFTVTFNVTVMIETEEERKESKTQPDTVQGSLNDFVEETKEAPEAPSPHGPWTKYPERKVHTCSQCGAPNRHNNPRKGGCIECRASESWWLPEGGLIE
jgi:hypothetical protein